MASHNADNQGDQLVPAHGKINVDRLDPDTRRALLMLAQDLRLEEGLQRVQVTFDDLQGDLGGLDDPPTVHAILAPDGNPDYWFNKEQ